MSRGQNYINELVEIESFDGVRKAILNSAACVRDARGEIIGAVVVNQDVTELRRAQEELRKAREELELRVAERTRELSLAQEELRRQKALLQDVIDFVPHCMFWKDRDDRYLGANRTSRNQFYTGPSVAEIVGKNDFDFFPKAQAEYFRTCDTMVMESGKPMLDIEETITTRAGEVRVICTSKVPLFGEDGRVTGVLGSFMDITERKRMEQELEVARKAAEAAAHAKSEFLATVSHELRTPLTLIMGPLEVILSRGGRDLSAELREDLERIRRNAVRLFVLVNDILDFTKIESGKAQVRWEAVDAAEVVSGIVSDAAAAARDEDLRLSFAADPALGVVPLDRGKFEKIVLNLLGNALKFTQPGGRIDVELRCDGADFVLLVADTGPGIALERQALLFQKFQQLDSSATRKYEGTGLGLALVKRYAELMAGSVGVQSEPGRGSTFFVRLARAADRATTLDGSWPRRRSRWPPRRGSKQPGSRQGSRLRRRRRKLPPVAERQHQRLASWWSRITPTCGPISPGSWRTNTRWRRRRTGRGRSKHWRPAVPR